MPNHSSPDRRSYRQRYLLPENPDWEGGISKGKAWFIRDENDLVLYEKDIIRMQVRDDVIEILPSLQILSDYVEGSSFFSRAERNAIVRELVLYNKSSTLNKILQFDFSY